MSRILDPTTAYLAISDRERAAAGDGVERRAAESASLRVERADRAQEREALFPDGARVHYRPAFDRRSGILRDEQTIRLFDGTAGSLRYAVRAYDPAELIALLDEAGFACRGPFGATDGSRQADGDPNVIVVRTRGRARTGRA